MKGLWVEIRTGTSLTNYCHKQNQTQLGEISLIYYQSNQSMVMRNETTS